ncbi:sialic acid-binding Ig-like lectin 14 isoform X2 [Channa argus]|uniref:sialic acid-binding Ig-like lectin 14 isoform X2 n=1 Tax=Channa argus TaxID=215402 RepID=UPI0035211A6D
MFFFKWATLLLAVWRHSAGTESPGENKLCQHGSCFNLSVAGQTAEAGLCVVIPCSFTTNEKHTAQHVAWYKCEGSEHTCNKSLIFDSNKNEPASEFKERVSMLEPDLSKKNCSITIRNLKKSDSGFYEVRVYGKFSGTKDDYMLSNKTNITVTDLRQKPTVTISSQKLGEQTTVTCTAPGLCSEPVPQITWKWRGNAENVFHDTVKSSNLTFNLSAEHHGAQVTCKISFTGNMTTEETLTLNVTGMKETGITKQSSKHPCTNQTTDTTVTYLLQHLGPSVVLPWTIAAVSLCVNICLISTLYLWNTRKKVKPNKEDAIYMSLKKPDQSSEYDVIAQPLD